MALNERSRAAFYEGLHAIMDDEEAIGDVVSNFPARDVEEPATKEFMRAEFSDLRSEIASVRTEVAGLRGELHLESVEVRGDMGAGLAGARADMGAGLAGLRTDMGTGFAAVRADMALKEKRLMVYIHDETQGSQRWTLGLMITMFGLLAILIRIS